MMYCMETVVSLKRQRAELDVVELKMVKFTRNDQDG